jgi:hypothetical protein
MFEGYCGVTKNVITLHSDDKFRDLFGHRLLHRRQSRARRSG